MRRTFLSLIAIIISACAPHVALKRDAVPIDQKILIVRRDSPVAVKHIGAGGVGMMFGAIGGAISGAIDGVTASRMTATLNDKLGGWDLPEDLEQEFVAQSTAATPWRFVHASDELSDEQDADFLRFYSDEQKRQSETNVGSGSSDHRMDTKQKEERLRRKNKVIETLDEKDIRRVLVLDVRYWGFTSEYGHGDFQVEASGKLIDPRKADAPLWSAWVASSKRPGGKRTNLEFDDEMKKTPEEIQGLLKERVAYVSQQLAADFR